MSAEDFDLRFASEFAEIARELHQETEQQPTLERVTKLAVQTITPCDYCGISVRDSKGRVTTPASTDPIVNRADEQQYELGEGPSLEAIWSLGTCMIEDMDGEQRWPRWAAEASRLGIKSVLSIRLEPPRGNLNAALNLYSTTPRAFDVTDYAIAGVFARHAANALTVTRDRDELQEALRSRQVIGIAEGILMQRFDLTLDQAFELLRRYSGNHNIKLRILAENLAKAGRIPLAGPGSVETADHLLEEAFQIDQPDSD